VRIFTHLLLSHVRLTLAQFIFIRPRNRRPQNRLPRNHLLRGR
jgi:hypothetical protein